MHGTKDESEYTKIPGSTQVVSEYRQHTYLANVHLHVADAQEMNLLRK